MQVWAYLDVHNGPEHELYVKYAECLTVYYVTIWYGAGMPILYVLAVLHYFVYWCVTRYHFIYKLQ